MATYQINFDQLSKALDWWTFFNEGQEVFSFPAFVADGINSRIEIDIAPRGVTIPDVVKCFAVKQAYDQRLASDQIMYQNLDYDPGTAVNCYDPDPALRGRYVRQAPNAPEPWERDTWQLVDKCWADHNHPERLLELLVCSWIKTTPAAPGAAPLEGWRLPNGTDWRNAKITFDMRCQNLFLGPWAKICQHVQGDIPRLTWQLPKTLTFASQPVAGTFIKVNGTTFTFRASGASGNEVNIGGSVTQTVQNLLQVLSVSSNPAVAAATYVASAAVLTAQTKIYQQMAPTAEFLLDAGTVGGAVAVNPHAYPNFIFTKQLISDQLGFGNNSWGKKNNVSHVVDSGRRDVVLEYSGDDADWQCLGAIDRSLSFFHYIATPVAELLTSLRGNSYMMAVHPKPQPDSGTFSPVPGSITEAERVAGKIMIYGIKIEVP